MINSIEELKARIVKDVNSSTSKEDCFEKGKQEWDEMSPEIRNMISDTIMKRVGVVQERVAEILKDEKINNTLELRFAYIARHGKADLSIFDYLVEMTNKKRKEANNG